MTYFINLFLYFYIYSFLGWCCEVVYAYKNQIKFVNRGFLIGPICPIYGFCALSITKMLNSIESNILFLFIFASIVVSLIEYYTGYLLEKTFNKKYWDYSEDPFNIHGRICLHFSLIWGILAVFTAKIINPIITNLFSNIPLYLTIAIFYILFSLFIMDILFTLYTLINKKRNKFIN